MKYNSRISVLKAIGILLVVWGHTTKLFADYVYSFHMPLFFWVAGYLRYGKKDIKWPAFLSKKTKSILLPYVVFWIISMLVFPNILLLLNHHHLEFVSLNNIKGLILGGGFLAQYSNNFALWFLQLFFIATIIFEIIVRYLNKQAKIITFIILVLITIPVQTIIPGRPVFHINILPAALIFMIIGYYTNYAINNKNKILIHLDNRKTINLFFLLLGFAISMKFPGNISEVKSIIYLIGATLTITGLYNLVKYIKNSKVLNYIGKRTLYILGLHSLFIAISLKITNYIAKTVEIENKSIIIFISVTITVLICCAITDIYKYGKQTVERKYLKYENNNQ